MMDSLTLGSFRSLCHSHPSFPSHIDPRMAATPAVIGPSGLRFHCNVFHFAPRRCGSFRAMDPPRCVESSDLLESADEIAAPTFARGVPPGLVEKMTYDALVWSSLNGLAVRDRRVQGSGTVPGIGLVQAPFALLPMSFPVKNWKQASHLALIFNELIDRVSLDGKFLQDSLSRTKKVDPLY